VNTVCLAEKNS